MPSIERGATQFGGLDYTDRNDHQSLLAVSSGFTTNHPTHATTTAVVSSSARASSHSGVDDVNDDDDDDDDDDDGGGGSDSYSDSGDGNNDDMARKAAHFNVSDALVGDSGPSDHSADSTSLTTAATPIGSTSLTNSTTTNAGAGGQVSTIRGHANERNSVVNQKKRRWRRFAAPKTPLEGSLSGADEPRSGATGSAGKVDGWRMNLLSDNDSDDVNFIVNNSKSSDDDDDDMNVRVSLVVSF